MIIVTAGPNLFKKGVVSELCKNGLRAIRIPSSKQPPIEQINKIIQELSSDIKVIIDFPGGKFRINNPDDFHVTKGEVLKISKKELVYDYSDELAIYPKLSYKLNIGEVLIVGDGETALSVIEEKDDEIIVKVQKDAVLGPRRGITLQNMEIKHDILTENDYENMECLSENIISGVMLSFIEEAEEVKKVKDYIYNKYGRTIEVYVKIETEKGIENLQAIADEANYIVLARGDLLITAGEEKFPLLQQKFLEKMKLFADKTIIATELAHSVGSSYLMSRSELTFLHLLGSMGYKNLMLASETTVLCDAVEVFNKVSKLIDYYSLL